MKRTFSILQGLQAKVPGAAMYYTLPDWCLRDEWWHGVGGRGWGEEGMGYINFVLHRSLVSKLGGANWHPYFPVTGYVMCIFRYSVTHGVARRLGSLSRAEMTKRGSLFITRFRKIPKAAIKFVMSDRPSARNNSVPIGRIFMKFGIWIFFSKICP
jgi:hypothetical protein